MMIPSNPTCLQYSNSREKEFFNDIIINNNNNNNISNISSSLNKNDIQIKLFDPVVIFRGNANESVGSFLRGEILLKLNKPTEITCIELKFSGKTKILCPNEYGKMSKYKKEIISENINLSSYPTSSTTITPPSSSPFSSSFPIKLLSKPLFSRIKKDSYTFSSGIHKLSFEIHLPGSLPESITTGSGSVKYKLKFKFDYITTFCLKTLLLAREVEIIRIKLPDYINHDGIEISRRYNQIIDYQLSVPKKSFTLDETIPINLKIIPLIKQFKLHSIEIILVQKITYIRDENEEISNIESVQHSNNSNNFQFIENDEIENLVYEKLMILDLSKCNDIILHHSVETPLIRIKHELKFCFLVSIPNNIREKKLNNYSGKSKLCFSVKIDLLNRLVKDDDDISLPNYDDVSFYCHCHPQYQRIARFFLEDSFNNINDDDKSCNHLTCNYKPPIYK